MQEDSLFFNIMFPIVNFHEKNIFSMLQIFEKEDICSANDIIFYLYQ